MPRNRPSNSPYLHSSVLCLLFKRARQNLTLFLSPVECQRCYKLSDLKTLLLIPGTIMFDSFNTEGRRLWHRTSMKCGLTEDTTLLLLTYTQKLTKVPRWSDALVGRSKPVRNLLKTTLFGFRSSWITAWWEMVALPDHFAVLLNLLRSWCFAPPLRSASQQKGTRFTRGISFRLKRGLLTWQTLWRKRHHLSLLNNKRS